MDIDVSGLFELVEESRRKWTGGPVEEVTYKIALLQPFSEDMPMFEHFFYVHEILTEGIAQIYKRVPPGFSL